jgi:hypothetical protein
VLLQLLKEGLRQPSGFDEQAVLATVVTSDEHSGINDVLVDQPRPAALLDMEGQPTPRETVSLLPDVAEALAPDWDS